MTEPAAGNPPGQTGLSPRAGRVFTIIQTLLPTMTAIIGGLWVAFTYVQQQHEAQLQANQQWQAASAQTTVAQAQTQQEFRYKLFDLVKPIASQQDSTHLELAQIIGKLLAADVTSQTWIDARERFLEIYWGIFLVNHQDMYDKAGIFQKSVEAYRQSQSDTNRANLEAAAVALDRAIIQQVATAEINYETQIISPPTPSAVPGSGF